MGALSDYDDLAGYEFGEFAGFLDKELLTKFAIAGVTGAAAILGGTYASQWLAKQTYFASMDAKKRAWLLSGGVAALGVLGGIYAARRGGANSQQLGIALAAGAAGLAIANLAGSFFATNPLGTPLGEAGDEGVLSGYDFEALNGLAETVVDPIGAGAGAPQLAGVVVDQAGGLQGYQPWLS